MLADYSKSLTFESSAEDSHYPSLLEKNPILPKLSLKFIGVFMRDTLGQSQLLVKYKAFQHWSTCSTLIQRCDELSKQLSERSEILNSLRESYLRDVIRYKTFMMLSLNCE